MISHSAFVFLDSLLDADTSRKKESNMTRIHLFCLCTLILVGMGVESSAQDFMTTGSTVPMRLAAVDAVPNHMPMARPTNLENRGSFMSISSNAQAWHGSPVALETSPIQTVAWGADQKHDMVACDAGCKGKCDCPPRGAHRTMAFGEFLYLRARDAEVAYAVPINSVLGPPDVQVGPVNMTDPDHSTGFRTGVSVCMDDCSSVALTWTMFQSNTVDAITLPGGGTALRALVLHPGAANAASNFLDASAQSDIDFDLVDADYRALWWEGECSMLNYVIGARYARMDQDFNARFSGAGSIESLVTDVNFDGAGLRFGLEAERHGRHHGMLVYSKAYANILAGDFRARYFYNNDTDPVIVNTSWKAGRVMTQLEVELGVGWQSPCGRYRVTGGYHIASWFNALTTDKWIQAVQDNTFTDLNDTMTFDGLTFRAEYRF